MQLILMGCEYVGKTTLALALSRWMIRTMGLPFVRWHHHFVLPTIDRHLVVPADSGSAPVEVPGKPEGDLLSEAEEDLLWTLPPRLLEQFQRHMIWRHLHPSCYQEEEDYLWIDGYYAEAVYAPLYYGYGYPGTFADRRRRAQEWDREVLRWAPETILVLVEAEGETIRQRMWAEPRRRSLVRAGDIEEILRRFAEEYEASLLERRFRIETTGRSGAETLEAFLGQLEFYLTLRDRQRVRS